MGGERGAHGLGLAQHVVIAGGQVDGLGREQLEIVVDHREQLEAEVELRAGAVELAEGFAGAARRARSRTLKASGDMVTAPLDEAVTRMPLLGSA